LAAQHAVTTTELQICMSGRIRTILSDGRQVRGYRKTLRRTRPRPVRLVQESSPPEFRFRPASPEYPVRLTFLLPLTILVAPGPHGFNTVVLPQNIVQICGRETDRCFALARCFFAAVAREHAGFTCRASITHDDDAKAYGRHLTVVQGAMVVSGGLTEPRVYDAPSSNHAGAAISGYCTSRTQVLHSAREG
jgi:hypothetical protein